jgi:single-strand DNA-binding protein
MNKSMLTGRLTKDPQITEGEKARAKFTLACNRRGEGADFISCVAFGKTAEFIRDYFKKGMKADIAGHIHTGSYEKDGKTIYTTDVVVDEIEFGESKRSSNEEEWHDAPEGLPFK